MEECEKMCDEKDGCRSITYCPGNALCYRYDKKYTEDPETIKRQDDCRTHYRPCGNLRLVFTP